MSTFKVVVTDDRFQNSYEEERSVLEPIGAKVEIHNCSTEEEVLEVCRDADGILVNLAPMGASVIEKLRTCRVIARYGVGYDNVDAQACTDKGIQLANVTDYCFEEVSDHALALLLSCARKTAKRDKEVRSGKWNIGSKDPIYRIAGKTITFLGFGQIARTLHRKIQGFNFGRVLVYDPFLDEQTVASFGAEKVEWEEALREGDYITIHMPLNDQTRGIINKDAFSLMKPTAIVVNTSRGPVVQEEDIIEALQSGTINSAGLDVHTNEPLDPNSPFMKIENCVLTDHVGFYSEESKHELKQKAAENVRDALLGKPVTYPINKI